MSLKEEEPVVKTIIHGGEDGGGHPQKQIRSDKKGSTSEGQDGGGQGQKQIRSDHAESSDR